MCHNEDTHHPHDESKHSGRAVVARSALDGGYWDPVSHDDIETEKFNRRARINVYREDLEETELVPIDCFPLNAAEKRQVAIVAALCCVVWVAVVVAALWIAL